MCTVDLTAWSSGGLFKIELCQFNRAQKFIGKLAKYLSRHCQLSGKIEVVTVRQTRRFGLHPVDSWIIRLPTSVKEKEKIDERSEPSRVGFSPLQTSLGKLGLHVISFPYRSFSLSRNKRKSRAIQWK